MAWFTKSESEGAPINAPPPAASPFEEVGGLEIPPMGKKGLPPRRGDAHGPPPHGKPPAPQDLRKCATRVFSSQHVPEWVGKGDSGAFKRSQSCREMGQSGSVLRSRSVEGPGVMYRPSGAGGAGGAGGALGTGSPYDGVGKRPGMPGGPGGNKDLAKVLSRTEQAAEKVKMLLNRPPDRRLTRSLSAMKKNDRVNLGVGGMGPVGGVGGNYSPGHAGTYGYAGEGSSGGGGGGGRGSMGGMAAGPRGDLHLRRAFSEDRRALNSAPMPARGSFAPPGGGVGARRGEDPRQRILPPRGLGLSGDNSSSRSPARPLGGGATSAPRQHNRDEDGRGSQGYDDYSRSPSPDRRGRGGGRGGGRAGSSGLRRNGYDEVERGRGGCDDDSRSGSSYEDYDGGRGRRDDEYDGGRRRRDDDEYDGGRRRKDDDDDAGRRRRDDDYDDRKRDADDDGRRRRGDDDDGYDDNGYDARGSGRDREREGRRVGEREREKGWDREEGRYEEADEEEEQWSRDDWERGNGGRGDGGRGNGGRGVVGRGDGGRGDGGRGYGGRGDGGRGDWGDTRNGVQGSGGESGRERREDWREEGRGGEREEGRGEGRVGEGGEGYISEGSGERESDYVERDDKEGDYNERETGRDMHGWEYDDGYGEEEQKDSVDGVREMGRGREEMGMEGVREEEQEEEAEEEDEGEGAYEVDPVGRGGGYGRGNDSGYHDDVSAELAQDPHAHPDDVAAGHQGHYSEEGYGDGGAYGGGDYPGEHGGVDGAYNGDMLEGHLHGEIGDVYDKYGRANHAARSGRGNEDGYIGYSHQGSPAVSSPQQSSHHSFHQSQSTPSPSQQRQQQLGMARSGSPAAAGSPGLAGVVSGAGGNCAGSGGGGAMPGRSSSSSTGRSPIGHTRSNSQSLPISRGHVSPGGGRGGDAAGAAAVLVLPPPGASPAGRSRWRNILGRPLESFAARFELTGEVLGKGYFGDVVAPEDAGDVQNEVAAAPFDAQDVQNEVAAGGAEGSLSLARFVFLPPPNTLTPPDCRGCRGRAERGGSAGGAEGPLSAVALLYAHRQSNPLLAFASHHQTPEDAEDVQNEVAALEALRGHRHIVQLIETVEEPE
ncbi:unnamed protein product, partial [Closterium sp. Naga37s-1]